MDFYLLGCVALLLLWTELHEGCGQTQCSLLEGLAFSLPGHMLVLYWEGLHIQLTKKPYGRDICLWSNCDSVQHDRNKVLLFPLKLIIKRVEFVAVNFIVFLQVVLFFSPSLFVLTWFLGGFSFCYLISRENILLVSLASYISSMFWHGGACGPF